MKFYSTYHVNYPEDEMFRKVFWNDKHAENFCNLNPNVKYKPFHFKLTDEEKEKFNYKKITALKKYQRI